MRAVASKTRRIADLGARARPPAGDAPLMPMLYCVRAGVVEWQTRRTQNAVG